MVYYKLVLNDKRPKLDNIYPIEIRITFNRKNTTVSTGIRISKNEWDSAKSQIKPLSHNLQLLNKRLTDTFSNVQKIILKLQEENNFSFDSLKTNMAESANPSLVKSKLRFQEFAESVIDDLHKGNKSGNALCYQTALNRLDNFVNKKPISFEDINYELLEKFKSRLTSDGVKINTISNYLRALRALYNRAIKAKYIDKSYYPFADIQIKSERTAKRAVDISNIASLYNLNCDEHSTVYHSRNYFILSFCLIGMSFTDLAYIKPENIKSGRLIYRRRKTHKEYNIKLNDIALQIISRYYKRSAKYILPILPETIVEDSLEAKKRIKQFIKTTNKYLSELGKSLNLENLTTYVARCNPS